MPNTARFTERIGKIFLPEADTVDTSESTAEHTSQDFTPNPEGPIPIPKLPGKLPLERLPLEWPPFPERIWPRFCFTRLRQGCYTLSFVPTGTPIFGTRYRGTLRVERPATGIRFSGDLYTSRLLDDIISTGIFESAVFQGRSLGGDAAAGAAGDEAADTGGTIPLYPRRRYHSYLKGTSARLLSFTSPCSFTLEFDEFVYNHPAAGFSGSFNTTRTRGLRFVLRHTGTADLYSGDVFSGTTLLGTVSLRWVSSFYRRAALQLHTLQGFEAPPASVGGTTFASIFAGVGWDVSFSDGGTVPLPAAISTVNTQQCWSNANLHTLMASVPGYQPADLDSTWRVHLVSVPARLGCSRGVMFDSSLGADPNAVPREGAATFSRDGYPSTDTPHYDTAADQQQRNVPRAFLRSATHEVGHAFNQIHQGFELGNDNSIMTPTPSVATVLGTAGTFPDDINLGFNDTVARHLRHLPDPAVRPGAMDFFGSAVSAPEASDVAWPETLVLDLEVSADQAHLGEPVEVAFTLRNDGPAPVPVPERLDLPSLTVRINVTDPNGRITFLRPATVASCPKLGLTLLQPGKSVAGRETVFWGRDGFAFETPGRHLIEVIVLWDIAGAPIAASATRDLFVRYPVDPAENDVAALLLTPEVGVAIASKRAWAFEGAMKRIRQAAAASRTHPANRAMAKLANLEASETPEEAPPPARKPKPSGASRRTAKPRAKTTRRTRGKG